NVHIFFNKHLFGARGFIPQPAGTPSALDPSGLGCATIPASCPLNKFRTYDGTCNNLRNPVLGTPNTPYNRLLPQKYGDEPHQTRCCSDEGQFLELASIPEHCFPIVIPDNDIVHARNNIKLVYGNTVEINQQVRLFRAGRLRVEIRRGQQWPPRSLNASGVCVLQNPQDACYLAGDARANQNPQLTILQIIFIREHNRIAAVLGKLNPHWDDEIIFQEARKINMAQHQHITYYEWLPIFIGLDNSINHRIIWETNSFVNDYNDSVNPTVLNEHATAAFRYFHSLIAGNLHLITESRKSRGSLRLSDWFNRPQILEEGDNFDDLARGLNTQHELASDQYHDSENVQNLASLYECPDDVDLTVGGSLEVHVPGTLVGPTFLCILTEQFYRTRVGDRFWFENEGETGFTLDQLYEIRKSTISRLLCDNGRNIRAMQPRGFEKISPSNAVVPCESLPAVDLSLWKEARVGRVGIVEDQLHLPPHIFYKK
ncbi:hypothetical protein NQ314_020974, partial [Rhamnusium bicolor]